MVPSAMPNSTDLKSSVMAVELGSQHASNSGYSSLPGDHRRSGGVHVYGPKVRDRRNHSTDHEIETATVPMSSLLRDIRLSGDAERNFPHQSESQFYAIDPACTRAQWRQDGIQNPRRHDEDAQEPGIAKGTQKCTRTGGRRFMSSCQWASQIVGSDGHDPTIDLWPGQGSDPDQGSRPTHVPLRGNPTSLKEPFEDDPRKCFFIYILIGDDRGTTTVGHSLSTGSDSRSSQVPPGAHPREFRCRSQ
jgi:hypothetical protein